MELIRFQKRINDVVQDKINSKDYDNYLNKAIEQYQLVLEYVDLVEKKAKETVDLLKLQEKIHRKARKKATGEARCALEHEYSLIKPKIQVLKTTLPKLIYVDRTLFGLMKSHFVPQLQGYIEEKRKVDPFDEDTVKYLRGYELYYMKVDNNMRAL